MNFVISTTKSGAVTRIHARNQIELHLRRTTNPNKGHGPVTSTRPLSKIAALLLKAPGAFTYQTQTSYAIQDNGFAPSLVAMAAMSDKESCVAMEPVPCSAAVRADQLRPRLPWHAKAAGILGARALPSAGAGRSTDNFASASLP